MKNKKYQNWYKDTRKKLKQTYKQEYKIVAGLIASTSPRFSVKRNVNTSKRIYNDFIEDRINFIIYAELQPVEFMKKYKILFAHYNNILKTLKHDYKKTLVLSGLKVKNFYFNLTGNFAAVTVDVWILRAFHHVKKFVNGSEYAFYSKQIRQRAKKYKISPAAYQANLWIITRLKAGFKPVFMANFI